jgi:Flp pilus assembly protein TadB
MFRQREEMRKRLNEIVEIFRQKGATSPEKAMTAQELGLPPRFEEAMQRRLGRLGIFVEVNGKYYLSEERLRQLEEQRSRGGGWGGGAFGRQGSVMSLRIVRMAMAALFVVLILVNLFVFSWELRLVAALVAVTWVALTIAQIAYMARNRRMPI